MRIILPFTINEFFKEVWHVYPNSLIDFCAKIMLEPYALSKSHFDELEIYFKQPASEIYAFVVTCFPDLLISDINYDIVMCRGWNCYLKYGKNFLNEVNYQFRNESEKPIIKFHKCNGKCHTDQIELNINSAFYKILNNIKEKIIKK